MVNKHQRDKAKAAGDAVALAALRAIGAKQAVDARARRTAAGGKPRQDFLDDAKARSQTRRDDIGPLVIIARL